MPRNEEHGLTVAPNVHEAARQRFVLALKQDVGRRLRPQLKTRIDAELLASDDDAAISQALDSTDARKVWSVLARGAQQMMWQAVSAPLLREQVALNAQCEALIEAKASGGSLTLDPTLEVPEAMARIPVHMQPGGYCRQENAGDVMAGALYEAGGALYSQGQSIGVGESKAELVIRFLAEQLPTFRPLRILDLACSSGGSSTPYARLYPNAEVHAVDVAPGLLRYASARAESMGLAVHFHQCNVADTGFSDGSFDLVVSHNAMHEMPPSTISGMMRESYRLLRPGGVVIHQDVPLRNTELDAFSRVDYSWDHLHNNEPYWQSFAAMDLKTELADAGFSKQAQHNRVPQLGGGMAWDLFWAIKEEQGDG